MSVPHPASFTSDTNRGPCARLLAILVAAALFAFGCSGETNADGTDAAAGGATSTTETSQPAGADTSDTADTKGSGGGETWDDPRGAMFAEFQSRFDRSHPFGGLERFCESHDPATDRVETDRGITADTIAVHHLRNELENLVDIGFGVDVGDMSLMFQAFVDEVNDCGGIRGRTLELVETSFDSLSPDVEQARVAACVKATEDDDAVVVMNTSGFQGVAALCLAEEHQTPFITNQGFSEAFLERGGGNLITQRFSLDDSVRLMVERIAETGALDGKTIAVIGADTPGQPEVIESSLLDALDSVGLEAAVVDIIGCNGLVTCTDGVQESVGNLKSAGVDVLFPALNILSLPGYVAEMVTQGFAPGDVQFYNSEFEGQSSDLVSSKVAALGGEAAAALYDGTVIVDSAATGAFRLDDAEATPFNQMCLDLYAQRTGITYDWNVDEDNTPAGMLINVCSIVRMAARALYDAGPNPTRDEITSAFADLGPIDVNDMLPATIGPGKYALPDANQTMNWTSPCTIDGAAFDDNNTCIIPDENYELTTG